MRVAIVHYWFVTWRGGEKVVQELLELFPDADLYTHIADLDLLASHKIKNRVYLTGFSKIPFARKLYKKLVFLMPFALEQLDLTEYDLVISSESGPAKNIIVGPDAVHICYCHSPMRYVWDMYPIYRKTLNPILRALMAPIVHYLKIVDRLSADRVDYFIANSNFVAKRIQKAYRRPSKVIHPPVAIDDFELCKEKEDFYLVLGQMIDYKQPQLAVRAFNRSKRNLVLIGDGELNSHLRSIADKNVTVLGKQSFDSVKDYLGRAKALIFPGVEDFGIVPLEAMACGTPVIAYRRGGALETVVEGVTGVFFDCQNEDALIGAVSYFEENISQFVPEAIRMHASQFGEIRFQNEVTDYFKEIGIPV